MLIENLFTRSLKSYDAACEFPYEPLGFFAIISHLLGGILYCLDKKERK